MGIKTIKVLRTVSKIMLLVIVLGLLGWGGYYVYRSIAFKPQNIVVTNITDSSATITWTTSSQMNGVVYYKKDSSVLPGPLAIIGSQVAYDDRDVSDAQTACVNEFNKNAIETKDEDFSVSGENFDCENARVAGMGKYYTHSVTIKDLDAESTYYFSMGDGIWSFKSDVSSVRTFALLGEVKEPSPVFGRVVGDDGRYSRDSLVYLTFSDGSEGKDSIIYSSTTNDSGGWYLDSSNACDPTGTLLPLEELNDTLTQKAILGNYGVSGEMKLLITSGNGGFPDVVVYRNGTRTSSLWERLLAKAYASTCGYVAGYSGIVCSDSGSYADSDGDGQADGWRTPDPDLDTAALTSQAEVLGYGNVAKALSATGNLNNITMTQMGLDSVYDYTYLTNTDLSDEETEELQNKLQSGESVMITMNSSASRTGSISYINEDGDSVSCSSGGCTVVTEGNGDVGNNITDVETGQLLYTARDCQNDADSDECSIYCFHHPNVPICRELDSDPTYCLSNNSCEVTQAGFRTCSNHTWIPTYSCSADVASGNSEVVSPDLNSCTIIPEYGGMSYTADYGDHAGIQYTMLQGCTACGVSVGVYKCQNTYGVPDRLYEGETGDSVEIAVTELNPVRLLSAQDDGGVAVVNANPALESLITQELEEIYTNSTLNNGDISIGLLNQNKVETYCRALGLSLYTPSGVIGARCDIPGHDGAFKLPSMMGRAYANNEEELALYLPEYGIYSFELGSYTFSMETKSGVSKYLFYIEANGVDGFQAPLDEGNPTSEEDLVLGSSAYNITYSQNSASKKYELQEGVNILAFDFLPTSSTLGAYTAENLLETALKAGVNIKYVSTFDGGRWFDGYSCLGDVCTGTNFTIIPGKGYLVRAENDGSITIPGYNITSSIPIPFSSGWNLVGIHGYTTAYTARTLIDSINAIDGLTANNVSWWPTSKGKYEGLQVENGTEYGLDFAISPTNGYFVRISEYTPSDSTCKSTLWNDGGTLNGTCGNTK